MPKSASVIPDMSKGKHQPLYNYSISSMRSIEIVRKGFSETVFFNTPDNALLPGPTRELMKFE